MREQRIVPRTIIGALCVAMILALGAVGATPALALDTTTTGNAPLWFQFNVGTNGARDLTSHVSVTLRDQAACSGGFQVFTSGDWSYWSTPDESDLMGRATDIGYDMHMWSGELVPGAYYVRVGYGAKPGCVLGVSGEAVDFLGIVDLGWHLEDENDPFSKETNTSNLRLPATHFDIPEANPVASAAPQNANPVQSVPTAAPAAASANPVNPVASANPVTHHEMEVTPNEWTPVTSNEPMMFQFNVGDVPGEQTSDVSVTLYGAPFRGGRFEIFTAEDAPFAQPEQDDWFGRARMRDGEHAAWHGDLVPGAYYVLVYPRGIESLRLAVSGEAVAF